MDIDWAGGFGSGEEGGPGFLAETTNEKGFGFLGSVLEGGGAEADILLERVPVSKLLTEGCVGEVGGQVIKEDAE